jgi:hypothetical protein
MKKPMKKLILSEEFRRMQKLAGIITEEEYMNQGQGIEQFEDYIDGMWEASISDEMEDGEYYEGVWEKSEYSDEENYPLADQFNGLSKYLSSVGGKATLEGNPDINLKLMPNGDIKFGATVTLDESLNENVEQFEDYVSDMFNMSIPEDAEEGEYFEGVWEKKQFGDKKEYDTKEWYGLTDYLKSVGGKATLEGNPNINLKLMPNGDIKFGATVSFD